MLVPMAVSMTRQDIYKGIKFDPCLCPLGRCIRRAVRHTFLLQTDLTGMLGITVEVGAESVLIGSKRDPVEYPLPELAIRFLEDHDEGAPVLPIHFFLMVNETALLSCINDKLQSVDVRIESLASKALRLGTVHIGKVNIGEVSIEQVTINRVDLRTSGKPLRSRPSQRTANQENQYVR